MICKEKKCKRDAWCSFGYCSSHCRNPQIHGAIQKPSTDVIQKPTTDINKLTDAIAQTNTNVNKLAKQVRKNVRDIEKGKELAVDFHDRISKLEGERVGVNDLFGVIEMRERRQIENLKQINDKLNEG